MRFPPKSNEELNAMGLVQPGDYDFQVLDATDKLSKSGNEMIEMKVKIWDIEGRERVIFDYLLESMAFKLKHFCDAAGLAHKYESGSLMAEDCVNKCGKLSLIIQKDKTGQYSDKNSVKDYIVNDSTLAANHEEKATITKDDFQQDDVPF